jgi:SAM-dependent methyltransferase
VGGLEHETRMVSTFPAIRPRNPGHSAEKPRSGACKDTGRRWLTKTRSPRPPRPQDAVRPGRRIALDQPTVFGPRTLTHERSTMLSRNAKAAFYAAAGPFMSINAVLYRHLRAPKNGPLKVHLGPGQKKYIDGWVNVDANMFTGKCDVWADLRNPLPFHSGSIEAIYSHHVIEHLPSLLDHFRDAYRCLAPGGVYRVGGPNGDSAIRKFAENDARWFGDFPDERSSIGGKFENFIFCRREHLTILTSSFLEEVMSSIGFTDLRVCKPVRETHHPQLFQDCLLKEYETDFDVPHTLIIEGVKPVPRNGHLVHGE